MTDYRDSPLELHPLDRGGAMVNVRAYGAKGDGVADDHAAFVTALAALPAPRGGVLYIPPGTYRMTQGLAWSDRPIILRGCGAGIQPDSGTRLVFAAGVTGITMQNGPRGMGAFSRVEGLHIVGSDARIGTNDGVRLQATGAQIAHCHVEGFGRYGIYVESGGSAVVSSNANTWYVEKVRCSNNFGGGFATFGADSNAGLAIGLDADSNGGYGIYENSNLGNTYYSPHLSGNSVGAIRIGPKSKNNRMFGVYKETDGKPTLLIEAGGGANNYVDFLLNEEPNAPFTDLTESKNNFIVTSLGGMHFNRLAVGTATGLDVVMDSTDRLLALMRGTKLRMQSAAADANWTVEVLANRRLSVGSAQAQPLQMNNPVYFTQPVGFYGTPPAPRPALTYSRAGETTAQAQLRTALAQLGLVLDSTTP